MPLRLPDWYLTQPKVIGTDAFGSPIEGDTDTRQDMRGRFLTQARASALLDEIAADLGIPRPALEKDPSWDSSADPFKRNFYTTSHGRTSWELGQLFAYRSVGGVDAPGHWEGTWDAPRFVPDPPKPVAPRPNPGPTSGADLTAPGGVVGDPGAFTKADRALLREIRDLLKAKVS
jgi:hypothetical protein